MIWRCRPQGDLPPDFWYFCYDNESYGNTGMQMSSATPYGVRTQTTPVSDRTRVGTEHGKKDLFAIWLAHRPAYLATVSPRYPVDLTNKFLKAKARRAQAVHCAGAVPNRLALRPRPDRRIRPSGGRDRHLCPQGSRDGVAIGHLHSHRLRPVEDYSPMARTLPTSLEPAHNAEAIAHIQAQVDAYWSEAADGRSVAVGAPIIRVSDSKA